MAEYIGARISLISNSDIRYVGTLHEINSDNSTVALENVRSMGTEDRRTAPGTTVAPNDRLYEYIVFRGSDVKDLRIEEAPKAPKQEQPSEVPDDPAILGSTRPPQQAGTPSQPQQPPFGQPPPYGQGFPPYPPPPHMHNQGFGRGGFPGGPPPGPGFGYPGPGPYGAPPPGWFPPGQGFPPGPGGPPGPGPFSPQPPGAPQQNVQPPRQQQTLIGPSKDGRAPEQKKVEMPAKPEPPKAPAAAATSTSKEAPVPPVETKPDVAAATAPPAPVAHAPPTGPKGQGRAPIPINPAARAAAPPTQPSAAQNAQAAANTAQSFASATQAATAAVAAAMAKLPMAQKMGQQGSEGATGNIDNLTKKVQEMRTDDHIRHGSRQGTGGHVAGHRGRGRGRGGHHQQSRPVEVPTTDFDFESSNAKFNKDDVLRDVNTTSSPAGTPGESAANGGDEALNGEAKENETQKKTTDEVVIPKAEAVYNKKTSFFDNISSELKDRDDKRGQEFRSEERKKNMETFGQGSVDNYRRGFGRGRGGRGFRGGGGRGGGGGYGPRGGRGNFNARPQGGQETAGP